jgi:parallel beta-helix repeat protein
MSDDMGRWTNTDVNIVGNTLLNHRLAGIYLKDTSTYLITGNEIHDCGDGIMIVDSTIAQSAVEGGIVSNNLIHHVRRCGLLCVGGHLIASSNSISHFGSEPPPPQTRRSSIFLSSLKPGSSITGNTINTGRHGIVLTGQMSDFVIANNCCTNVLGYGIYFIDFVGEDWIISANKIGSGQGQAVNRPTPDERKIWSTNL